MLLLWVPLRQKPGIGTVSNVLVIGYATDISLLFLGSPETYPYRFGTLVLGILLNGIAGAAYIGAGLGPGPRDGLMTGLVARTGGSVRVVSSCIEITILAIGWLIGGVAGIGTVLYAASIGWIVHHFLPILTIAKREEGPPAPALRS